MTRGEANLGNQPDARRFRAVRRVHPAPPDVFRLDPSGVFLALSGDMGW